MKNKITTSLLASLLSVTSACTDSNSNNSKTGVVAESANKESVEKKNVPEKIQPDSHFTQLFYKPNDGAQDFGVRHLLVTEEKVNTFELTRDQFFGNPRSTSVNLFIYSNGTFELSHYYREDDLIRGIQDQPWLREKLSDHVGQFYIDEESGNLVLERIGILSPTTHDGLPAAYLELFKNSLLPHESDNRALIVRSRLKVKPGSD